MLLMKPYTLTTVDATGSYKLGLLKYLYSLKIPNSRKQNYADYTHRLWKEIAFKLIHFRHKFTSTYFTNINRMEETTHWNKRLFAYSWPTIRIPTMRINKLLRNLLVFVRLTAHLGLPDQTEPIKRTSITNVCLYLCLNHTECKSHLCAAMYMIFMSLP